MKKISFFDVLENDFSQDFADGAAVTIGGFDGQHSAHRILFEKVKNFSAKTGAKSCAVVFSHSPHEASAKNEISTPRQKFDFFEKNSFDFLISIDNFKKICIMSGEDFFSALANRLKMRFVALGEDFRCGKDRAFGKAEIAGFCRSRGIECEILPDFSIDGIRVHSSEIREKILAGDLKTVEKLLGEKFKIDCSDGFWKRSETSLSAERREIMQILPPAGVYEASAKIGTNGEVGKRCVVKIAENQVLIECGGAAKIREVYL